jgi:hypothetical protein
MVDSLNAPPHVATGVGIAAARQRLLQDIRDRVLALPDLDRPLPLRRAVPGRRQPVYVFLSPGEVYTDAAAAALPHYTCGQTYFYPAFDAAQPEDAAKLAHELGAAIAMPLMLEAITRIRASKGQSLPPQRSLSH